MTRLTYDHLCAGIVAQTDLLRSHIAGADMADMTVPVPSCPGWNVGQLVRHLGGGQRWAEEIVRTRPSRPPSDDHFRDLSPYAHEDPAVLDGWLAEGAALLAGTLSAAGPDMEIWTPLPDAGRTTAFWARRFAHETLIHRADAALALGAAYVVAPEVAADAVDEWLDLASLPQMLEFHPQWRELLGPGRTLRFQATDAPPDVAADWLVDLTGDAIAWRPGPEEAAVTVRGPLTDLLLLLYRRYPEPAEGTGVVGDARLFDFWQERVAFG
ncbi:maleylpyruvate isomerase family mycothiol-dependent enzyme [Nocardiopsis sediminis]|uniref:Maleylpyruvate isomerase family mycothiol-dependent enzyme n=1 Tax=Nocardiopsis sediminis TaxID=1778267 RepID=A0ABV8FIS3_9ACTN